MKSNNWKKGIYDLIRTSGIIINIPEILIQTLYTRRKSTTPWSKDQGFRSAIHPQV